MCERIVFFIFFASRRSSCCAVSIFFYFLQYIVILRVLSWKLIVGIDFYRFLYLLFKRKTATKSKSQSKWTKSVIKFLRFQTRISIEMLAMNVPFNSLYCYWMNNWVDRSFISSPFIATRAASQRIFMSFAPVSYQDSPIFSLSISVLLLSSPTSLFLFQLLFEIH